MRTISQSVTVCLLIFILGCNYEPEETYFKEISDPDLSKVSLDLSTITNDTVYLFDKTTLNIQAFLDGRDKYSVNIFMDGTQIRAGSSYEFIVDASLFNNGPHVLRVEIYARSGTGSLADKVGAEQLKIAREWVALIDNTLPDTPEITFAGIEAGKMKVRWSRYLKFNFGAYVLEKQYWSAGYNMYLGCWTKEISNKNVTSWNDSTYLGGKIRYRLKIKAGQRSGQWATKNFDYTYDPSPTFTWLDRENVKVSWRKPKITQSFKNYDVSMDYQPSKLIAAVGDTTLILKPSIVYAAGASVALKVNTYGTRCEGGGTVYTRIVLGSEFARFNDEEIIYCRDINKYFTRTYSSGNYYSLSRIDGTTKKVEQSVLIDGYFAISPNGKYLYVSYDNVLRQYDPLTFAVIKTHNLYELDDVNTSVAGRLMVSDNHFVSFVTYNGNYVVKMPSFEVVYRGIKDDSMGLSPSGNTLVSNGKLWRLDLTTYIAGHNLTGGFRPIFKDDNILIRKFYDGRIAIQNLATQVEKTVGMGGNIDVYGYDPVSDKIGYAVESYNSNNTSFYVLDLEGNTLKTITIMQVDNHRGEHYFLVNNQIICSTGSTIPLSYYYP